MVTQEVFDGKVGVLFENEIRFGNETATMRRQGDPAAYKREEYLMMFQNILFALRDYDVSSELLPDDEINYLFELGTQLSLNWPK